MKPGTETTVKDQVNQGSSSNSDTLSHHLDSPDSPPYASPVGSPELSPVHYIPPGPGTPEKVPSAGSPQKPKPGESPPVGSPENPSPAEKIESPEKPSSAEKIESPEKPPQIDYSKAIVAVNQLSSLPSPEHSNRPVEPKSPAQMAEDKHPRRKVVNRVAEEDGPEANTRKVPASSRGRKPGSVGAILRRTRREELFNMAALGFRVSEMVLSLISFSLMAADRTQGWSGDSFDRYKEYRFCLAVSVIASVYSGFQASDLAYYFVKEKHLINHHLRPHFDFFMDQVLAYLLVAASSAAASRVDDWQSNWGKDKFTEMASASVSMAFLAFLVFAFSSLISGYRLCARNAL